MIHTDNTTPSGMEGTERPGPEKGKDLFLDKQFTCSSCQTDSYRPALCQSRIAFTRNISNEKEDVIVSNCKESRGMSVLKESRQEAQYRPLSGSPLLMSSPRLTSTRLLGTVAEVPASSSESDTEDATNTTRPDTLHDGPQCKIQNGTNKTLGHRSTRDAVDADQQGKDPQVQRQHGNHPCESITNNDTETTDSNVASSESKTEISPEYSDSQRRASSRISAISEDGFRTWVRGSHLPPSSVNSEHERSYMDQLKTVAGRLNLSTRRPSVQAWRERVIDCPPGSKRAFAGTGRKHSLEDFGDVDDESEAGEWSCERRERINDALGWLQRELVCMGVPLFQYVHM